MNDDHDQSPNHACRPAQGFLKDSDFKLIEQPVPTPVNDQPNAEQLENIRPSETGGLLTSVTR
jgi:hypothetical protein